MSLGKTYKEAFQKADPLAGDRPPRAGLRQELQQALAGRTDGQARPSVERAAVPHVRGPAQRGRRPDALRADLHQALVHPADEGTGRAGGGDPQAQGRHCCPTTCWSRAKKDGFADKYLAKLAGRAGEARSASAARRWAWSQGWHAVPVSGVENAAYYYSSYNAPDATAVSNATKVMVLGGGPNRIGQGIEFDYCCVHAAFALRDEGYESIMVNCNPETVSTDYDTSNKLYFEPLTVEDVLSIYEKEKPRGRDRAVRRPDAAEHRRRAGRGRREDPRHLARHDRPGRRPRPLPPGDAASWASRSPSRAWPATWTRPWPSPSEIGYPLMVRPSFVLGGRAMEVVHDEEMLRAVRGRRRRRLARAARSSSTASWRTPSRSRPTAWPTARTPSCPP